MFKWWYNGSSVKNLLNQSREAGKERKK